MLFNLNSSPSEKVLTSRVGRRILLGEALVYAASLLLVAGSLAYEHHKRVPPSVSIPSRTIGQNLVAYKFNGSAKYDQIRVTSIGIPFGTSFTRPITTRESKLANKTN